MRFSVGDHAEQQEETGVYLWRGYLFRVKEPIMVTGLRAGAHHARDDLPFWGALWRSDADGKLVELLRSTEYTEPGIDQLQPVTPVLVLPGRWYVIGHGGTILAWGSPEPRWSATASVKRFDTEALLAQEPFIAQWHPVTDGPSTRDAQFYGWYPVEAVDRFGPPSVVLGLEWYKDTQAFADARPLVGFDYFPAEGGFWTKKEGWRWSKVSHAKNRQEWKPSAAWQRQNGVWVQIHE